MSSFNRVNHIYNSKLCFDDLLKISQRDYIPQNPNNMEYFQNFHSNVQFNNSTNIEFNNANMQFNNSTNVQFNNPTNTQFNNTNIQFNKLDVPCMNSMSSLFNLSPYESIPTNNIKPYDDIDINIEEIPLSQPIMVNQDVVKQNVNSQNVIKPNAIKSDVNSQNTNSQNGIKQNEISQEDIELWFPQQNTHEYDNVMTFVDKILEHFNALFNLNKMTLRHYYNREYVFDIWKQTLFCTKQGLVPLPYPLLHKSYIKDQDENTIAMILASQKIYIPRHWVHKPTFVNKFGETVAIIYAKHGIIPPQEWKHKAEIVYPQNGQTVFMLLIEIYCKEHIHDVKNVSKQQQLEFDEWIKSVPSYWIHSDEIVDKNGNTITSQVQNNSLQNNPMWNNPTNPIGKPVCNTVNNAVNNTFIDMRQPTYQELDVDPFSMPPGLDQDNDDPYVNNTFANISTANIPTINNTSTNISTANNMLMKDITMKDTSINISTTNNPTTNEVFTYNNMFANETFSNINGLFQQPLLQITATQEENLPVKLWKPLMKTVEWDNINRFVDKVVLALNLLKNSNGMFSDQQDYTKQNIFDFWRYILYQVSTGYEIPQRSPLLHNVYIKDHHQNTIAMILAKKNIQPIPDYLMHSPNLINDELQTVAMLYAKRGTIPSEKWKHKKAQSDKNKHTVLMLLMIGWMQNNKINYNSLQLNRQDDNTNLSNRQDANTNLSNRQDIYNKLLSDRQAKFEKWFSQIPDHWIHNPKQFDQFGNTVALILAQNGIIPPKCLQHRPELMNSYRQCVADYLFLYRLNIPTEWIPKTETQTTQELTQEQNLSFSNSDEHNCEGQKV